VTGVRASRAADAPRLKAIWGDAVDATHHFLAPGDRSAIAGHLAIYVETTPLLVLERDGVVVGFLGQTAGHVDTLFVDPAAHGRGVGRALMAASAGTTVDVAEANGAAIGATLVAPVLLLFAKFGWIPAEIANDPETVIIVTTLVVAAGGYAGAFLAPRNAAPG